MKSHPLDRNWVVDEEVHSPAASNGFDQSSTCSNRQPSETLTASTFTPRYKQHEYCHKLLHTARLCFSDVRICCFCLLYIILKWISLCFWLLVWENKASDGFLHLLFFGNQNRPFSWEVGPFPSTIVEPNHDDSYPHQEMEIWAWTNVTLTCLWCSSNTCQGFLGKRHNALFLILDVKPLTLQSLDVPLEHAVPSDWSGSCSSAIVNCIIYTCASPTVASKCLL